VDQQQILVIDDDEDVLFLIEYALKRLGVAAHCATDGARGMDLYRNSIETGTPYAAVIVDMCLPGGKGARELIAPLLALEPSAKVFVTSGYPDDPCLTDYLSYGFCGAVPKPITYEILRDTVVPVLRDFTDCP
jgi:DNA-binding NtrC family response regulator